MKVVKRIVLGPSLHKCVETLAKQKYWGLVDEYVRRIQSEGISQEMELEIDALRSFLEDMDVGKFRKDEASVLECSEEHTYKERQLHSRPGFVWRFLLNMI